MARPKIGNKLTRREREVYDYILAGLRNKEIAERMTIEDGTVKNHVHNILTKLGVSSRRHLFSVRYDPSVPELASFPHGKTEMHYVLSALTGWKLRGTMGGQDHDYAVEHREGEWHLHVQRYDVRIVFDHAGRLRRMETPCQKMMNPPA